jgi:hypothetical protein
MVAWSNAVRARLFTTTHFARYLPVISGRATTDDPCKLIVVTRIATGAIP